jgi:predicted DCC family thiol-disulfide oxidoreductase YuxK
MPPYMPPSTPAPRPHTRRLAPPPHPPRRSEAILRIGLRLSLPLPLLAGLAQLVPLPLRDGVYEQVADNRWAGGGLCVQLMWRCRCQAG